MSKPPFHSFSFTLVENKRPRQSLRLVIAEDDLYELKVQKGSAANPSSQFTRKIPLEVVERFRDALQNIGVFNWEESYSDTSAPGSRRWTVSTVFQEGVFSVESKGGSDVPRGFDELLEELYRLDFPRPAKPRAEATPVMPTSIGDLAAFASKEGLPGFSDLANLNSAELQQRMKEEFRHMSPDEQNQLIDMLVQMGAGTRDYWERFFGLR
jgi:hypothetical protein